MNLPLSGKLGTSDVCSFVDLLNRVSDEAGYRKVLRVQPGKGRCSCRCHPDNLDGTRGASSELITGQPSFPVRRSPTLPLPPPLGGIATEDVQSLDGQSPSVSNSVARWMDADLLSSATVTSTPLDLGGGGRNRR